LLLVDLKLKWGNYSMFVNPQQQKPYVYFFISKAQFKGHLYSKILAGLFNKITELL
jgi:hypothetical protein